MSTVLVVSCVNHDDGACRDDGARCDDGARGDNGAHRVYGARSWSKVLVISTVLRRSSEEGGCSQEKQWM